MEFTYGVWGLGFRVWGAGSRVHGLADPYKPNICQKTQLGCRVHSETGRGPYEAPMVRTLDARLRGY